MHDAPAHAATLFLAALAGLVRSRRRVGLPGFTDRRRVADHAGPGRVSGDPARRMAAVAVASGAARHPGPRSGSVVIATPGVPVPTLAAWALPGAQGAMKP